MSAEPEICESGIDDASAIESLYPEAFPDEDLLPLVRKLLRQPAIALSLVAIIDQEIAGHAIFTKCGISGSNVGAGLLGPLAVAPACQRRGIGSALVHAGLERLKSADAHLVCVLGDPAYYGRLGFEPERLVAPPYRLPAEWQDAWQSKLLSETNLRPSGKLTVPPVWRQPALWAP